MKLPTFSASVPIQKKVLRFCGIHRASNDQNDLYDAVNLTGSNGCSSREARRAAMLLTEQPDQILPLEERLFFRFGNTLREITAGENGDLTETGTVYPLRALSNKPDRILIPWEDSICVLPDGIRISEHEEVWQTFGANYAVSTALPFSDSRTLFYPSGYSGEETCDEVYLLVPGTKVKFSWLIGSEFTILAADKAYTYTNNTNILAGFRITLDAPVSGWNALPGNASMSYTTPNSGALLMDLKIGYHHELSFFENRLQFYATDFNYSYSYSHDTLLYPGQAVTISGSGMAQNNRTLHITEIGESFIAFDEALFPFTEPAGTELTIHPLIPHLDFAILADNRLIGADNSTQTFWVSRQDQPFVFHLKPTVAEDAWSCRLTAQATGIALWKDSVLCFQGEGGFRLFGGGALNFGITQLPINGIRADSITSLSKIGDTLFYASPLGIMKYTGSSDICISTPLPDGLWVQSSAGFGGAYYALADDRLWVYAPDTGHWWSQNAEGIQRIFTAFGGLYLLRSDVIYQERGGNAGVSWQLVTAELPNAEEGVISPHGCCIEATSNTGCVLTVFLKRRGSRGFAQISSHSIAGETTLRIPFPKAKCDGFQLKIEGCGDICVHHLTIEYRRLQG